MDERKKEKETHYTGGRRRIKYEDLDANNMNSHYWCFGFRYLSKEGERERGMGSERESQREHNLKSITRMALSLNLGWNVT